MQNELSHNPETTNRKFSTPSVVALDAFLNARVAAARSNAEISRWLRRKSEIKRRLVGLPSTDVEREAARDFERLRRSSRGR